MKIIDGIDHKKLIYLASIIIALGVILISILNESKRPIGVVMIAIGGLFFIIGMNKKQKEDKKDV